jgi:hypothetical protein
MLFICQATCYLIWSFIRLNLDSQGTQFYLKLMDFVTSSYLNKSFSPEEKLYRMWFANFCLRGWRYWMNCDNCYSLQDNFVTTNFVSCVEINSHALVLSMLQLKKLELPQCLVTWHFGSQACENEFRLARSCSSYNSTQVNFSMKNFVRSRCQRIAASRFYTEECVKAGILIPRHRRPFDAETPINGSTDRASSFNLPSLLEIEAIVGRAKKDAETELNFLGMIS